MGSKTFLEKLFPFKKEYQQHQHGNQHCHCDRNYKLVIEEIKKLRRILMATKQEVLDAIAAEKAQVTDGLAALNVQIQELKDQIANGQAVTPADLDEIVSAVNDIFIPA